MSRAPAMSVEDRRAHLIDVTLPLLREHGRTVTTSQIARAAGIAEGTVFRAFESKEALIDATIASAVDPTRVADLLRGVDAGLPLRERLIEAVGISQRRMQEVFGLMAKVGVMEPPRHGQPRHHAEWHERIDGIMVDLVGADREQLRVHPQSLVVFLRLLTFAGSHPHLSDEHPLTPAEIVDLVLDGTRVRPGATTSAPLSREVH
ncbi:TetR/AcrR family transcriptional regulator [Janibacter sp. G1551]|uniref:TetR/AcrR family transcriptional regulator n=1 Tax=Janibacter sp. G1551 TaxID=3420440 RepID=UPI003D08EEA9